MAPGEGRRLLCSKVVLIGPPTFFYHTYKQLPIRDNLALLEVLAVFTSLAEPLSVPEEQRDKKKKQKKREKMLDLISTV